MPSRQHLPVLGSFLPLIYGSWSTPFLINWRFPMVSFSTSRKGLSSTLRKPSPTTIIVTPLLDLMTSNNPKLDWCNYGHNVSFNFDYILIWFNDYFGEGNGTPLQYSCLENPMDAEPCGLQFMGSRRVGHDWVTSLSLFTFMHWRRKWQPTPVFLPGESQGRGSLVGCSLWGCKSWTRLKWLSSSSSNDYFALHL